MSKNQNHHPAQVFVWWATGIGIIFTGIWAIFIYLFPTSIAITETDEETAKTSLNKAIDEEAREIVSQGCPGTRLYGSHTQEGHQPWNWRLNSVTGTADIFKTGASVRGEVTMNCNANNWSAQLAKMSHGLEYNCSGKIVGNTLKDGKCFTTNGGVIVVSGTFSE